MMSNTQRSLIRDTAVAASIVFLALVISGIVFLLTYDIDQVVEEKPAKVSEDSACEIIPGMTYNIKGRDALVESVDFPSTFWIGEVSYCTRVLADSSERCSNHFSLPYEKFCKAITPQVEK